MKTWKRSTPEQKARTEERRAKFRGYAKQIAEMSESQRLAFAASCPVVTIEGRALSPHNQCLVALQNPGASVVGGFRQWLKAGRCVRKGEHGLMIWCPSGNTKGESGTVEPSAGALVVAGESTSGEKTARPGFIMGTVFDCSQTVEIGAEEKAAAVLQPSLELVFA